MRRTLLAALALCCFATTAHAARGMNLRWDACMGDGGTSNRNFACNSNVGSDQLLASFQLEGVQFEPVNGLEFGIDIVAANSATLPNWWLFKNAGACRMTGAQLSASMLTSGGSCIDFWQGLASGGMTTYTTPYYFSPDRARLNGVYAVAPADVATLQPGNEYFAFRLTINHFKTIGTGSCSGCLTPMCLGLSHMKLTRPAGYGNLLLLDETMPRSSVVSWQNGPASTELEISPVVPPTTRIVSCSAATPARNSTWGSIKSLYH